MNREKNLIKNTGILAIGRLSSKVFTFLLLPLYTSLLLPEDYGTVDVLQTVISLTLYISTLQIESAIFRFIIDQRDDKNRQKKYLSTGIITLVIMSSAFTIIVFCVSIFVTIPYRTLFILALWAQALFLFFSNIARGLGRNIDYSVASFIVTIVSLCVNIVLIVLFKFGAVSILVALVVSNFCGVLYLAVRVRIWTLISFASFGRLELKEMLNYSLPLIPNAISWWIANTSDRLLIMAFLGSFANGIYAAANKIPTIYTTIFSVYNLAWSESVSLSMKDSDRELYINKMMNKSVQVFSFLNLGIICCVSLFFNILIGEKYALAYSHIFILLVAIFVNSMCSLLGGILTGFMESKVIGYTTATGAAINFIVNIVFIKQIGLYAASISTLVSYVVIYYFRRRAVFRHVHYKISNSFLVQLIIVCCIVSAGYFYRNMVVNLIVLIGLIAWGVLNNKELAFQMMKTIQKLFVKNK